MRKREKERERETERRKLTVAEMLALKVRSFARKRWLVLIHIGELVE